MLSALFASASAQTTISNGTPPNYVFDGEIGEWKNVPSTFTLNGSGRRGKVWVRQLPEGLIVAGELGGGPPDFATTADDMLRKDHVEIWIAPDKLPALPVPGWSNAMGSVKVAKRQDCIDYVKKWMPGKEADCDAWLRQVGWHRSRTERLFARQYGLSPDVAVEAFAKPAWEQIVANGDPSPWKRIEPVGTPVFKAALTERGYGFEALVPWDALPPISSLDLKALRLMVDIFSAHNGPARNQPFSSSSATRKYGDLATLNGVTLAEGRRFRVTGCEYPLATQFEDDTLSGFFLPGQGDTIRQLMFLVNPSGHHEWTPKSDSPVVSAVGFEEKELGQGMSGCGPRFAWRDASGPHQSNLIVDMATLEAKPGSRGAYLIKSGPWIGDTIFKDRYTPCFACAPVEFHLFRAGPSSELKKLVDIQEFRGEESHREQRTWDADVLLSADWSKITLYRLAGDSKDSAHWESDSFCREGLEYKSCGTNRNAIEPSPRALVP